MIKQRTLYGFMAAGGALGVVAAFLETIEYQVILKNADAQLTCNLNGVFSCTNVLNAWQSKVFGFPNSMMCMVFFTLMLGAGLVGLTGGTLTRTLRLWLHGIALFFLGFGLWFMWASTFQVRALCVLCLFCFAGLLTVNWSWLRTNVDDLPISERRRNHLREHMRHGSDTFAWLLLAAIMTFVVFLKFS